MIVPPVATVAVLGGAALHAAWNVGIRGAANRRASTAFLALAAGVASALILPFVPPPAMAAWPHLALTTILNALYFNLVAEAYSFGAVSLTYPVMRGTAPALTALIATFGLGEHLGVSGWAGLVFVSGGICLQTRRQGGGREGKALALALANAIVIAMYMVNDGIGRHQYVQTQAFLGKYRWRVGTEPTMSQYDRLTDAKHIRVRGFKTVLFAAVMKTMARSTW